MKTAMQHCKSILWSGVKQVSLSHQFFRMSSTCRVALLQITATSDKLENRKTCSGLLQKAKESGAQVAFLPEAFDFIGESSAQTAELAEFVNKPNGTIDFYKSKAKELGLALSLGGFHEKIGQDGKLANTHVFLDKDGNMIGKYSKAHLFDVEIPDRGVRLKESDYVQAGNVITEPVKLFGSFRVGLSICYDLRFPELSLSLRRRGANILTFPSAFTVPTGAAGHWSALLKARAIENQCYVIAAAQSGRHNSKRSSYGHACIIGINNNNSNIS